MAAATVLSNTPAGRNSPCKDPGDTQAEKSRKHSRQRNVPYLNVFVAPFVEELDRADFLRYILGKSKVPILGLNFHLPVIRHDLQCLAAARESGVFLVG